MKKIWLLLFFSLFIICSCSFKVDTSYEEDKGDYLDVVQRINEFDESLDIDFLNYIKDNYGKKVLDSVYTAIKDEDYDEAIWHKLTGRSLRVIKDYYSGNIDSEDVRVVEDENNIISFVGDISLADNFEIMPYYDSRGKGVNGILDDDILSVMRDSSIMVANNEFTVSNRGTPIPNKLYTFRAKPERLKIYDEMGVDLVSIANNHAFDFGEDAFLDTLDSLKDNGTAYIGGGRNIDEAKKAFYYIINGYKVSFVSATRAEKYILTPEATSSSPGVFRCYNPEALLERIREEKEKSDIVILLIHWGREDSHNLEDVQIETGKLYIDAGADLIVGSHAHVLQGMEFYNGNLIAYNLGDFIFNRESKDTGILKAVITNDGKLEYEFIPCRQHNYSTSMLDGNEKKRVLNDMRSYSINTLFDDNGKFYGES